MCPKNRRQGIVWSRTRIGQADYSSCPEDTVGKAIRECKKNGWLEPTFTNCTNKKYSSFESFTTSYEKKNIYLSQKLLVLLFLIPQSLTLKKLFTIFFVISYFGRIDLCTLSLLY